MNIKDKIFNKIVDQIHDGNKGAGALFYYQLSGAQMDTLKALSLKGPLYDGEVPSKSGRDELIEMGLAVRVTVKGEEGYTAATYLGSRVYRYGAPFCAVSY